VFRRRSSGAAEVLEEGPQDEIPAPEVPARPGLTQAKGRPTPKRSEAERRRRQPFTAPADRKAATRQYRDRDRSDRVRRQEAMRRGEDWALRDKDKGPVKKLARDYVDSRRGISEYYLFGVAAAFVLAIIAELHGSAVVTYLIYLIALVLVGEGMFVGNRVVRLAQQRFPGESTKGLKWYAASRGMSMRRMRIPAPQVKPGDKI
jgi:hypothetical protein